MKYYIHVRGSKIPVTETVYKSYWQLVNHEKYLNRKDRNLGYYLFHHLSRWVTASKCTA